MLDLVVPDETSQIADQSDRTGRAYMSRVDADGVRRVTVPLDVFWRLTGGPNNNGKWAAANPELVRDYPRPR